MTEETPLQRARRLHKKHPPGVIRREAAAPNQFGLPKDVAHPVAWSILTAGTLLDGIEYGENGHDFLEGK